jgi:hypothetical protein
MAAAPMNHSPLRRRFDLLESKISGQWKFLHGTLGLVSMSRLHPSRWVAQTDEPLNSGCRKRMQVEPPASCYGLQPGDGALCLLGLLLLWRALSLKTGEIPHVILEIARGHVEKRGIVVWLSFVRKPPRTPLPSTNGLRVDFSKSHSTPEFGTAERILLDATSISPNRHISKSSVLVAQTGKTKRNA